MIIAGAYWAFLVTSLVILYWNGSKDGRTLVIACTVATGLTFFANFLFGFKESYLYIFLIDSALLFVAINIVLTSDKYWPMWFAGFHLVSVCSSVGYFLFPSVIPALYNKIADFWAVPALGAAAIGAWMDQKRSSQVEQI
jgi:hypothetical protein